MARIELQQVSKTFGDNGIAVRGVDLQIEEGEFFVLVGPSGCGKSTLLNLIVGLEPVSAGTVRVDGKVVNDLDPKDRNMAMVFQHYALYPHMSVRENLAFPLMLAKRPRAEIDQRVAGAAELLELTALLDRRPSTLSGGQRQRVAMGRAMVRQPAAFLMDEPLSNLDAKLRVQMRHEIAQLQRRLQVTTVYVTHDQTEAMTLADRVAVLHQGEVQQVGTPQQLYERPANRFVAEFIGSPTMNLLPAVVGDGKIHLPMLDVPVDWAPSLPSPGRILAGVRPEHFTTARHPDAVSFQTRLSWIDWLGPDAYGWFPLPETAADAPRHAAARLDAEAGLRAGDTVTLFLQPRHVHWFDSDGSARL